MKLKKGEHIGFENNCYGLDRIQVEQLNSGKSVNLDSIPDEIKHKFQAQKKQGSK
jgi:hypothetical protein